MPAILSCATPEELRALVLSVLALAEAAPVVEVRSKRGARSLVRAGIDTGALQVVVDRLDDPALTLRLEPLLPQVP